GFEIGGLVGVILAGAARRVPVALDGFIAGAAALVAATLAPSSVHAMFASHRSVEPGHERALAHLGLVPYLDLGLRLGEGTGAALFVHLARAAARVYTDMATFKSAVVDGPAWTASSSSRAPPAESARRPSRSGCSRRCDDAGSWSRPSKSGPTSSTRGYTRSRADECPTTSMGGCADATPCWTPSRATLP